MTITNTISRRKITTDGTLRSYDIGFPVQKISDLRIILKGETRPLNATRGVEYNVTGNFEGGTGVVEFNVENRNLKNPFDGDESFVDGANIKSGVEILFERKIELRQTTEFVNSGPFFAKSHENAFDKSMMIAQQNAADLKRAVKKKLFSENETEVELPEPKEDSALVWDSEGQLKNRVVKDGQKGEQGPQGPYRVYFYFSQSHNNDGTSLNPPARPTIRYNGSEYVSDTNNWSKNFFSSVDQNASDYYEVFVFFDPANPPNNGFTVQPIPIKIDADIGPPGADAIIGDNTIITRFLADGAVTTDKIADSAVTRDKLSTAPNRRIGSDNIDNVVIQTKHIANGQITQEKIDSGAITDRTLANRAVTESKIASRAVTTNKIDDDAVTNSKIADDAVTTDKIADDAVTPLKIEDGAVANSKIADRSSL